MAVIEWMPAAKAGVEIVAAPAVSAPVPSAAVPSEKVTEPVAAAGVTAPAPVTATLKTGPAKAPVPAKKGGLTAAGRKALSIAMKKRWAAKKKAVAKGKAA